MLQDALRAPGRGGDTAGTLLIGGILLLVTAAIVPLWAALVASLPAAVLLAPIALAPAIVVRGFYLRVVAAGLEGASGTPAFVRWGDLYRNGVKSVLLSAGYLLPLGALIGLGGLAAHLISVGRVGLGESGEVVLVVALAFLGLLSVGYLVAYAYLRPAALSVFASTGRLRGAFDPRRVLGVAGTADFATGWLLAMFVLLAGLTLAAPLSLLLVGFVLAFFVHVVAHSLYGRGAATALPGPAALADPTARAAGSPRVDVDPGAEPVSVGQDPESALVDSHAEPSPADPDGGTHPAGTEEATTDLEGTAFPDAGEADPSVQTGRDVPLTATDILPRAASAGGASGDCQSGSELAADGDADRDAEDESAFEWGDPVESDSGDRDDG